MPLKENIKKQELMDYKIRDQHTTSSELHKMSKPGHLPIHILHN